MRFTSILTTILLSATLASAQREIYCNTACENPKDCDDWCHNQGAQRGFCDLIEEWSLPDAGFNCWHCSCIWSP
jgi:hypothetical protein